MHQATSSPLPRPIPQIAAAVLGSAILAATWLMAQDPFDKPGLVVLLLPLIGALLPLVRFPFELTLTVVVLSYFRLPEVIPALQPLHLPEIVAIGALGALGWHLLATRRLRPFWPPELLLLLLFFAHVTLGVLFASNRSVAFEAWNGTYVKIVVITIALAWLATDARHFAQASYACVAAGLIVGGVAMWNKIHGIDLVEGSRVTIGRDIGSILGDPNDLALVILFPASFALGLLFTRGTPALGRVFGACTFVVLVLAILATQSRGGLLGLVAVAAPFIRQRIRSNFVLVALAVSGGAALFWAAGIAERPVIAAGGDQVDESAQNRLWAWETAFRMALSNPVTGVGLGTFADNYFLYTEHWTGRAYVAHSTWFQVLAETGFPGLFVFVSMVGLAFGRLLVVRRRLEAVGTAPLWQRTATSLLAALVGFVVAGTFLSQAFAWPIYVITALSAALYHCTVGGGSPIPSPDRGDLRPTRRPAAHSGLGIGARGCDDTGPIIANCRSGAACHLPAVATCRHQHA